MREKMPALIPRSGLRCKWCERVMPVSLVDICGQEKQRGSIIVQQTDRASILGTSTVRVSGGRGWERPMRSGRAAALGNNSMTQYQIASYKDMVLSNCILQNGWPCCKADIPRIAIRVLWVATEAAFKAVWCPISNLQRSRESMMRVYAHPVFPPLQNSQLTLWFEREWVIFTKTKMTNAILTYAFSSVFGIHS